jgi:hypothetical protein
MKKVLAVSCGLLLLLSCRKVVRSTDAIILDAGNTNADGCGWIVRIDNDFTTLELDHFYRIDWMHVKISYHVTSMILYVALADYSMMKLPLQKLNRSKCNGLIP